MQVDLLSIRRGGQNLGQIADRNDLIAANRDSLRVRMIGNAREYLRVEEYALGVVRALAKGSHRQAKNSTKGEQHEKNARRKRANPRKHNL